MSWSCTKFVTQNLVGIPRVLCCFLFWMFESYRYSSRVPFYYRSYCCLTAEYSLSALLLTELTALVAHAGWCGCWLRACSMLLLFKIITSNYSTLRVGSYQQGSLGSSCKLYNT